MKMGKVTKILVAEMITMQRKIGIKINIIVRTLIQTHMRNIYLFLKINPTTKNIAMIISIKAEMT